MKRVVFNEGEGVNALPADDLIIHQIGDLCRRLLLLTHNAFELESKGKGTILVYRLLSECASMIQMNAEERCQALAMVQWEDARQNDVRCFDRRLS
jgi:hypothetical protein